MYCSVSDDAAAAGRKGTGNCRHLPARSQRARHAGHQGEAGRGRGCPLGRDIRIRYGCPTQGKNIYVDQRTSYEYIQYVRTWNHDTGGVSRFVKLKGQTFELFM